MKYNKCLSLLVIMLMFVQCTDVLDKKPLDKMSGEDLFSNPDGVTLYMANLYYQLPVEDFSFAPGYGFNVNRAQGINFSGYTSAHLVDEAVHSEGGRYYSIADNYYSWWEEVTG